MLVRSFTFLVSVTGILAGVDGFILFPIWCVSRGGMEGRRDGRKDGRKEGRKEGKTEGRNEGGEQG